MNMEQKQKSLQVLCCYAREDRTFVDELTKHLRPLLRQGIITLWSDYNIHAGRDWEAEIEAHLETADIILLFVSADFIDSDYCYSKEMKRAMERHEQGEARVLPLILRFCAWQKTPLNVLQALPKDAKPVKDWEDHDKAYLDIVEGIDEIIQHLNFIEELREKIIQANISGNDLGHAQKLLNTARTGI